MTEIAQKQFDISEIVVNDYNKMTRQDKHYVILRLPSWRSLKIDLRVHYKTKNSNAKQKPNIDIEESP